MHEAGDRTRVTVDTDLKVVAAGPFGSGMLQQVSEKLLGQFVDSLEAKLAEGKAPTVQDQPQAEPAAAPVAAVPHGGGGPEPEPIDLLDLAGGGAVQKYAIAAVAALVVVLLILAVRRRHRVTAPALLRGVDQPQAAGGAAAPRDGGFGQRANGSSRRCAHWYR
jgi:hypothetical protein